MRTSEIERELNKLGMPKDEIPRFTRKLINRAKECDASIDSVFLNPIYASDGTLLTVECFSIFLPEDSDTGMNEEKKD